MFSSSCRSGPQCSVAHVVVVHLLRALDDARVLIVLSVVQHVVLPVSVAEEQPHDELEGDMTTILTFYEETTARKYNLFGICFSMS